ncbi:MAG: MFS transporter [Chloroflexi bacterium]|nr:MFS transporter [Chloroflexota bacterium]
MTNLQSVPAQEKSPILPYAWVILAVVYFASVVAPFNQFKIPPLMPVLMQTFQIDLTQAGLLMSIIAMIGLVLALPTGIILQRLGPKVTLLISLGLMAIGSSIGAFSNNFAALLGSRVIEGLGIGLMGVTAPATIAMWFPPERQGTPMGLWATWVPIGSVMIYNLSPAMAASFGWQSIWWAGVGFAALMIIVSGWLVTSPPKVGQASSQTHHASGLKEALSNRSIWLLALEFACMNFVMVSVGTYYPTFLNEVRGYPLGQAAFLSSITTLVVLFSAPAAGWFSDRVGSRRLVFSLPFLAVAVLLIFPFHVTGSQIIVIMVLQGLIVGAIPTATFAAAPEVMQKPEWAGLGLAVILIGQNFGQLLGPIFFSKMIESMGWATAGYLLIPFCLVGFISAWKVKVR